MNALPTFVCGYLGHCCNVGEVCKVVHIVWDYPLLHLRQTGGGPLPYASNTMTRMANAGTATPTAIFTTW